MAAGSVILRLSRIIKRVENVAALFRLILRFSGAEGLGKRTPKPVEACVEHFDKPAHVTGLCGVQKQLGLFGIAVTPGFVTLEQMKRHQCIEEVTGGPFMEAKPLAQFVQPERPAFKGAKHPEFDSAQERLRGPESRRELHDPIMGNLLCHFPSPSVAITRATNPADGISLT